MCLRWAYTLGAVLNAAQALPTVILPSAFDPGPIIYSQGSES